MHESGSEREAAGPGVLGTRDPFVVITQLRVRIDVVCGSPEQREVRRRGRAAVGVDGDRSVRDGPRQQRVEIVGGEQRIG